MIIEGQQQKPREDLSDGHLKKTSVSVTAENGIRMK